MTGNERNTLDQLFDILPDWLPVLFFVGAVVLFVTMIVSLVLITVLT